MIKRNPALERKILLGAIAVLSIGLAFELLFALVLAPRLQIHSINLDSDLVMDDDVFYEITGLNQGLQYFQVQEKVIEERLEQIPQVAEASVSKGFPNSLYVIIRTRKAVALLWKEDLAGQGLFAVDKDGVIFSNEKGISYWDLPVLSGVDMTTLVPGDRLDDSYGLLLQDLADLKENQPSYYHILSEVKLLPREGNSFTMLVYLTTHRVAAHCSLPLDREILEKAILVLDVLEQEDMVDQVWEVDIRLDSIRYRRKEV